jgi:SOS response associated peptidase (SRAP)
VVDGFYEWKREGSRKQPYYIKLRDGQPFAFAGLWDRWHPPDGQPLETCTILTTHSNELVQSLHDRMPVILPSTAYSVWLDPALREIAPIQALLTPYPAEQMVAYPVSTRVNGPAYDAPECVASLDHMERPATYRKIAWVVPGGTEPHTKRRPVMKQDTIFVAIDDSKRLAPSIMLPRVESSRHLRCYPPNRAAKEGNHRESTREMGVLESDPPPLPTRESV